MSSILCHALDGIIGFLFPPPPEGVQYCPDCGGTGYDKLWQLCEHCHGIGFVEVKKE